MIDFYGDHADFIVLVYPWTYCGGAWNNSIIAGLFPFRHDTGLANRDDGSRLVIIDYNIILHKLF